MYPREQGLSSGVARLKAGHSFFQLVWTIPEPMAPARVVGEGLDGEDDEVGRDGWRSGFWGNRVQGVGTVQLASGVLSC